MEKSPKERLLEAGAKLILEQGYNNTGINEVLNEASVPKGSFYYYFESKEEFGLKVIDYFEEFIAPLIKKYFDDTSINEIERIRRYFTCIAEMIRENHYKGGCPIGNLAQEMAPSNNTFREKLKRITDNMEKRIADLIDASGVISRNRIAISPMELAQHIFALWEGTIIKLKLEKNQKPFEIFEMTVFDSLLRISPGD